MAFHGVLDWRLALDVVDLLRGRPYDPAKRWLDLSDSALSRFADGFGFSQRRVATLPGAVLDTTCVVATHPLEEEDPAATSERIAEAVLTGQADGLTVYPRDTFNLLRRPAWVYSGLWT